MFGRRWRRSWVRVKDEIKGRGVRARLLWVMRERS